MNSSQIRFTQSVNGRQPQILANNTIVQQQNSSAPSNMVLLRHPITHATTNPNTVSVQGSTPVRSLVVSQPSNRPQTTTITGTTGANVQMYVAAQQPVSILPRGGLRVSNAPTMISQAQPAAITVQSAHTTSGIAVSANDSGSVTTHQRILPGTTVIRPKLESSPATGGATTANSRSGIQSSEDPAILAQVHKCHNFLSCLIRFSDSIEKRKNLVSIMQELIDAKITVQQYMDRVTDCLKSNSQLPQLRPFLEMVLPHLRREMYVGNLKFADEELRAPPLSALQARPTTQVTTTASTIQRQQPQPPQPVQHPQMVQAAQTTALRQSMGTVAIHTTAQRGTAPAAPRTIAVGGIPTQGLRALHPRPAPILTTVNTGQQQQQTQQTLIQQQQQQQQQPQPHTCAPKTVNTSMGSQVGIMPHAAASSVQGVAGSQVKRITPRTQTSTGEDYEEYNDVAMMGGVNLTEESRNILPTVSAPATASSRTCKEHMLVPMSTLRNRILKQARGINNISDEAVALISHALEERLKNMFTHLSVAVEHRTTQYRDCQLFEQDTDVRGQLKFLEEIDRAEKVRHDDEERAALIKAARSRSRNENMDHQKMKEKARQMMQKEYEMEKQREANITALAAIGSRKKRKLDTDFNQLSNDASSLRTPGNSGYGPGMAGGGKGDGVPAKRIIRRATMKDLIHVMERDPNLKRSQLIWKATLK